MGSIHYWATMTFINLQCIFLALVLHDALLFAWSGAMTAYCGYHFAKRMGLL